MGCDRINGTELSKEHLRPQHGVEVGRGRQLANGLPVLGDDHFDLIHNQRCQLSTFVNQLSLMIAKDLNKGMTIAVTVQVARGRQALAELSVVGGRTMFDSPD